MKGRALTLVLGGLAVVGAAAAAALALSPADQGRVSDSSVVSIAASSASLAVESSSQGPASTDSARRELVSGPRIPNAFANQADFIRNNWADGPNLADRYVQLAVPCGRECFALIIGDTQTGEFYESGMGFADMPELGTSSRVDSDLILLTWMNLSGGNCRRAIYRWDGHSLGGVSDILEYEYTDAGCNQFELEHVLSDLD